jgi:hypothetical protein
MYSDQHMRVSDAERQAVADRLAEHYGDGRLDQAEFDDRVERAMNAKTRADLAGLFHDLPETGAPAVPDAPRRGHVRGVPGFVFLVLLVLVAAHFVLQASVPWLWITVLVIAVLFITRGTKHSHPAQNPAQNPSQNATEDPTQNR